MSIGLNVGRFCAFVFAVALWIAAALCFMNAIDVMGWLLFGSGFFLGVWIISSTSWEYHNDEILNRKMLIEARTKFAMSISTFNSNQLQVLGLEYPELGIDFGVEPIIYVMEDRKPTELLLACLQKFLADSNDSEFADLRKYNDDKYLQEKFGLSRDQVRKQWQIACDILLRNHYLVYGSMVGSHSYQWKSKNHYRSLVQLYGVVSQSAHVLFAGNAEGTV